MTNEKIQKAIITYKLTTEKVTAKLITLESVVSNNAKTLENEAKSGLADDYSSFITAHARNEIAKATKQIELLKQTLQVLGA